VAHFFTFDSRYVFCCSPHGSSGVGGGRFVSLPRAGVRMNPSLPDGPQKTVGQPATTIISEMEENETPKSGTPSFQHPDQICEHR
jgi:hypothetical protein